MIQEAHIAKDLNYKMGNYRVNTSAEEKQDGNGVVTGGTAVMIHESIQQNIIQVNDRSVDPYE